MSTPTQGFDPASARKCRADTVTSGKWVEISKDASAFLDVLEADGLVEGEEENASNWQQVFTPATCSRRVAISTGQRVDKERMENLNGLHQGEQELLKEAQDMTLAQIFREDEDDLFASTTGGKVPLILQRAMRITDGERLLLLRLLEAEIRGEVDELSRKRGYTSFSPRAGIGNLIPHFAQTLLMDFFENCQNPNDAETIMLTEALGLQDVDDTEQWFEESREMSELGPAAEKFMQRQRRVLIRTLKLLEIHAKTKQKEKGGLAV